MKAHTQNQLNSFLSLIAWPALALLLAAAGGAGCAHTDRNELRAAAGPPPIPPLFLNGPAALLLTNGDGFSAHLVMQIGSPGNPAEVVSGELLGRGAMLLFEPAQDKSKRKRSRIGGFFFIWNVSNNTGYLLNDGLQGYAPVSSGTHYSRPASPPATAGSERLGGHSCALQTETVISTDGASTAFQVWRAQDLKGFPIRIASGANATPMTINFSQIRIEPPKAELFQAPEGFAKYESAELLMTELVVRLQNLKRKPNEEPFDVTPGPGNPGYRGTR